MSATPPGAPSEPTTAPARTPAPPRGSGVLAWSSLVVGIIAAIGAFNMFLPDPITMMVGVVLSGLALTAGIVAIVQYRRVGRPSPPIGIAGVVLSGLGLGLTFVSLLQFAFFFVFAERLEPPPEPVSGAQAAAEQAATERELAEVAHASAEMLEAIRMPDGSYPTRLAVTTDERQLISPDGVVIADLPFGTSVKYSVYVDATQYQLLLFGPNGTRAEVDSEDGITVEHDRYASW